MSKKVRSIYDFNVINEISNGTEVFYFNKLHPEQHSLIVNSMTVRDVLDLTKEDDAEFWTIEEAEEEQQEVTVNG